MKFDFIAPCLFGIEGLLADELKALGADSVTAENGRVLFSGDEFIAARANIKSRLAERVLLLIGSFKAVTFDQLFEGVRALPLYKYIGEKDAFPVKGWSLNSALHSIPDCQSIIKKAMVKSLSERYKTDWFIETGSLCQIRFSIHKDMVSIMIDLSGEGLHKRGYRKNSAEAPLKETLAAAIVSLARLYPDSFLYDPFCGSGTILIEAAMAAYNIAPGLGRSFAGEKLPFLTKAAWESERAMALAEIDRSVPFKAIGFDIDESAVNLTLQNAKKAGVSGAVSCSVRDISEFCIDTPRGVVITNPPYGERLLDVSAAEAIYRTMGEVFIKKYGYKYNIISPGDDFENIFGCPADKRRKLYNGMIKCQLYMYFK